ncbi:MAG: 4Fe-4S binding protein [Candidatus Coproplasma sp.]
MGKFFTKVKDWFIAHKPTKRRLIQLYAALLYNANIKGFVTGKIYTGDTKKLCVPGLNCYSCPGAVGACPLGALQDSLAGSKTTAPAYIFGILILFGLLLGRVICGFLCPFGLIQELLYKIKTPKLRKSRFTRIASYFKYILLIIVIAIPLIYSGIPVFCKYICPAGTLEGAVSLLANIENSGFYGMLGYLFSWKFCVLLVVVVASVFIYRFLCRFICPLGAIYSLFCKISLLGVKLDKDKCINCGLCIQGCKMDIKHVGDHECIQCGECISVCPVQAISWKGSKLFIRSTAPEDQPVAEVGKVDLLALSKTNAGEALAPVQAQGDQAQSATPEKCLSLDQTPSAQAVEAAEEGQPSPAEEAVSTEAQGKEVQGEDAQTEEAQGASGKKAKKSCKVWSSIKAAFKKPRFVVEFVAWVVALAVLITALVCYNLPDKKKVLKETTVSTYEGGVLTPEGYTTASAEKRVRVLYFWRTDMEESIQALQTLDEYVAETKIICDVVAVHSIYKDDRDVGKYITDNGLEGYSNIIFAQDDKNTNLYSFFGGDISVPKPITAVVAADGAVIYEKVGEITKEELEQYVITAQSSVVYEVGEAAPWFSLNTYTSAGGQAGTFNLDDCIGKVTVLNFWYTDCDPCKAELPEFNVVYKELSSEINMYAVHNSSQPKGGVQNWLDTKKDKNGLPWCDYDLRFAHDTEQVNLYNMLGGRGSYPMTVLLSAEGKITQVVHGKCSEEALRQAIANAQKA